MAGRTELEQLIFQMSADVNRLSNNMDKAKGIVNGGADQMQRRFDKLSADAGRTWGNISTAAGVAFAAIVGYSVKAASDAEELQNAFDKAFGAGKDGAREYAKTLSDEVGRSNLEVQEGLMQFRLLLKKLDGDTADAISKRLQARAIDVGSLYNKSDQEVIQKFLSGISGESEPLKSLGVMVNETAVKLELMRLGFKGNATEAPEAAKQIARANIILRETEIAAGDAADTLDSAANQAKRAKGEFRDAAAELGKSFLPIATKVASATADMAGEFNKLPEGVQTGALALLALVAASGPIAKVIGGLQALIKWAGAARIAMAGIGASGAIAGGGGVLAGAGVAAVPVVASLALSGDTRSSNRRDELERLRREERLIPKRAGLFVDKEGQLEKVRSRIRYLEAILGDRKVELGAADAAQPGVDPAIGDFELPEELKKGGGGKGKKGSGAGKAAAAANKARDQEDRLQDALARAAERELAARQDVVQSVEMRAQGALDQLDLEKRQREADLDRQVKDGALKDQAAADQIKAAEELARQAEREVIIAQRRNDQLESDLDHQQNLAGYDAEIAAMKAGMAKTLLEQLALERRALALRQAQERAALERDTRNRVDTGALGENQAEDELRALDKVHAEQSKALADDYTQRLSDGMQSAFDQLRSKADVMDFLASRFKAKLADGLFDMLAKMITQLGSVQGAAGAGGGGGGWLSAAASMFAGFFAGGGTIPAGQWGVVNDGAMEAVRGKPGGGIEVMNGGALRALSASRPGAVAASRVTYVTHNHSYQLQGSILAADVFAEIRATEQRAVARTEMVAQAGQAMEDSRQARDLERFNFQS